MSKNLTQKTLSGLIWQLGGAIFKFFLQFGVLVVLARLISKEDFGIVQSSLIVVGFSQLLSQMGIGPALVQITNLTSYHIRAGTTLSLILSIILFAIVFFSSGVFADFFNIPALQDVLRVVSVFFIFEGLTTVSQSLLLREMKQKILVQIDFISYLLGYGVVALILAYLDFGLWSLIFGQMTHSIVKFILTYVKCRHSLIPYLGITEIKKLLFFGGGFTIARFFNYLSTQGDNIITGRYLGAEALGIYSRAYSIMVKPVILIGDSLDKVLFPAMAARQHEREILIEAFINGSKLITFLCVPMSTVIIFSSSEIVSVLLGKGWEEVIIPLQILTVGLVFRIGYKMGDSLTKATGNVYKRAKNNIVYALCVFVGCYFGAGWGINGVALGTLFGVIVNYILMINLSLNILKLNWLFFLKRTFEELSISILFALIFFIIIYVTQFILSIDYLILFISYGFCFLACLTLLYIFKDKLSFIHYFQLNKLLKNNRHLNK